jgi:hypothetical protein
MNIFDSGGLEEVVSNLGHLDFQSLLSYFCLWVYVKQVVWRMKIDDMDHLKWKIRDAVKTVLQMFLLGHGKN